MRVISGEFGGRKLVAPDGLATRPTTDKVRQAVFNSLGSMGVLHDATVVDLFAGSGALGIEALSRGAAHAVFVEAAKPALACLRENLTKLGLDATATVLPLRVAAALGQLRRHGPFELVLCDPPWRDVKEARRELEALASAGLFAAGARIVLEHAAKDPPPAPDGTSLLQVCDKRRWGDTAVTLFEPADVPGRAGDLPASGP